jgi:hypothetical protein
MITVTPGKASKLRVPANEMQERDKVLETLGRYIKSCEPLITEIHIHNQTRTATVELTVVNGHMHITVTNTEEDSKFRFE